MSMKAGSMNQELGTGRGNRRGLGGLRGFFGKSERRDVGDRFRGEPGTRGHCPLLPLLHVSWGPCEFRRCRPERKASHRRRESKTGS